MLKSYFYAIADIAVGARCKCNGHASKCIPSNGENNQKTRVCDCKHNTAGPDCEKCLPFYNDAPWGRATSRDVHECKGKRSQTFATRSDDFLSRRLSFSVRLIRAMHLQSGIILFIWLETVQTRCNYRPNVSSKNSVLWYSKMGEDLK